MTEEVLVKVELDGEDEALNSQEKLRKSLTLLAQERTALNNAFKAGTITIDEHSKGITRVNNNIKVANDLHNQEQKALTGVKSQTDKLIASNKQLGDSMSKAGKSFEDATSNIRIAGVSIGDLTTKLASFANPVTATIGVVTSLSSIYARSTIGAKDLEFAHNQLSSALTTATNSFANLVSSAKDGEGVLSQFTNQIIASVFGLETAITSKLAAAAGEALEDLGREEIAIRDEVNSRLEENQESLTEINSDQTAYNDKLELTTKIINNLRKNETELVDIKSKQLTQLQLQLALDSENEGLQTAVLLKQREISNIQRDVEKKVQLIVRLTGNLIEAENKRLSVIEKQNRALERAGQRAGGGNQSADPEDRIKQIQEFADMEGQIGEMKLSKELYFAEASKSIQDGITKTLAKTANQRAEILENQLTNEQEIQLARIGLANQFGQVVEQVAGKNKALALAGIIIQKASAIAQIIASTAIANLKAIAASPLTFGQPWVGINTTSGVLAGISVAASAGAAVSEVSGFAGGGLSGTRIMPKHGTPIRRSNGDNLLATVKTGEVILNAQQQARLGGDETFRRMGVPGFASGGSVLMNSVTQQAHQNAISNLQIQDVIRQTMLSMPPIVVYADDISAKQNVNATQRARAKVL